MKNRNYFILFICILTIFANSCSYKPYRTKPVNLKQISDSILKEANEMYFLEKASWHSTDHLKLLYENDLSKIPGFFSYLTYRDGDKIKSVYLKIIDKDTLVFATFSFNNELPTFENINFNDTLRKLNEIEVLLLKCRTKIWQTHNFIQNLIDSTYKENNYEFKDFLMPPLYNFVYFLDRNRLRIFLLHGVNQKRLIPFGDDYVYNFDRNGKLIYYTHIHSFMELEKKIIESHYNPEIDSCYTDCQKKAIIHHHLGKYNKFITSTDICNFLLYGVSGNLFVLTNDYTSWFLRDTNKLLILKKEDFQKIMNNGKKKKYFKKV